MVTIIAFLLIGVTAFNMNLSLKDRYNQWFIPFAFIFIIFIVMIFYVIGINGIITDNFIIDNTSKMISDFLDQKSIYVSNIYLLSVAIILMHTALLNILNKKQSSIFVTISKIFCTIITFV